eukprot:90203-Pyramimonas_sp.AAC.1
MPRKRHTAVQRYACKRRRWQASAVLPGGFPGRGGAAPASTRVNAALSQRGLEPTWLPPGTS